MLDEMRKYSWIFAGAASVVLLCSCASVSVRDVTRTEPMPPARLPDQVLVVPFTFSEEGLRVDRSGAELETTKFQLQELMTRNLVRRLPKYVAPGKAIASNAPLPPGNKWLIRGNFDKVYQGSRLMRSVIGLGTGRTFMETTVDVYDLSNSTPRRFLRITTTGGSNISPGVLGLATFFLSGPMALTSLFNAVDGVRSGVTFDAVRTSREVNAALSEFLFQRGVISYTEAAGPKRLGQFPNRMGPPDRAKLGNLQGPKSE